MLAEIHGKNLFSWENLRYKIPTGISQITGWNHDDKTSEGSGKSSILNIASWVLYGTIPKDAKIDEPLRRGAKSCSGKVILDSGEEVHRSRKPNKLFILKPDGTKIQGKDAKETQKLINDILGMDFECFCQTVYFAQNYPKKFITANDTEKFKILSEIEDLDIFDRARKRAQDEGASLKIELLTLNAHLSSDRNLLLSKEKDLTSFGALIRSFETNQQQRIRSKEEEVAKKEAYVKKQKEQLLKYDERSLTDVTLQIERQKESLNSQIKAFHIEKNSQIKIEAEVKILTNTFNNLENKVGYLAEQLHILEKSSFSCPTCGGVLHAESKERVDSELRLLEEKIGNVIKERDFILSELADTQHKVDQFKDIVGLEELEKELRTVLADEAIIKQEESSLKQLKFEIQKYEEDICSLLAEIDSIKVEIIPEEILSSIHEIEQEIPKLNSKITKLEKDIKTKQEVLDHLMLLKDSFKEVKSFSIKSFLLDLSTRSTQFLQEMFEIPIKIEFYTEELDGKMSKIQTDVEIYGEVRSLGLYSGGQARRIQLAVDLALAEIVANRHKKAINLRVLDEAFKDLTTETSSKVIQLLQGLPGNTILIEHNPLVKAIVQETTHVELKDGVSYAV